MINKYHENARTLSLGASQALLSLDLPEIALPFWAWQTVTALLYVQSHPMWTTLPVTSFASHSAFTQ